MLIKDFSLSCCIMIQEKLHGKRIEKLVKNREKLHRKINLFVYKFEKENNCRVMFEHSEDERFILIPEVVLGKEAIVTNDEFSESRHMIHEMLYGFWQKNIKFQRHKNPS